MANIKIWKWTKRILLVTLLVALVVALFTVPDSEKHKTALVPLYQEVMRDAAADEGLCRQLEDSIMAAASKGVNEGVDEGIKSALDKYFTDPVAYASLASSESNRMKAYEEVKRDMLDRVVDKTRNELKNYLSKDTSSKLRTFVYGAMSKDLQSSLTEAVINNRLETRNYYLFSVGCVENHGKNHWLSVGVFGHVFTFDKSKLRKILLGQ